MLALVAAAAISVVSPGPITALAASGPRVAFASAPTARDCDRVYVWTPPARHAVPLGSPQPCGDRLSTGRGLAALSLAGDRALWLTYAGGNIREWSLWTATLSRPQPRLLRFVPRDVDSPSPIVVGTAGGGLLPYSVDRSLVVLRANGSRAFTWTAPATPLALSAGPGKVAVTLPGGRVVVLGATGSVVADSVYEPTLVAAHLTSGGLVLQESRSLGYPGSPRPLPPHARVEDVDAGTAAYVAGPTLHLLRLDTGRELTRAVPATAHAQLESGRIYVSADRLLRDERALTVTVG
jgi:hypothetical protein